MSLTSATGTTFPSGTVGIAGSFTPSSITSASQGIINFNGTTNQTVPAFNYNNLTLSGAYTSTNNLTLASSGNIGIAGNLLASASFGTGGYVVTGSTVNLNGTGTQTISSGFTFNTLNIYNGGVIAPATLSASNITIGDGTNTISLTQQAATLITVTNAFTVAANATFTVAAGTGSSISSGTNNAVLNFNSASGTITNNGTIAINGWFTNGNQNSSTATTLTGSGTWNIGGQGVYNHNTINGTIPTMTSWVAGSTLYYTGTHGVGTLATSGLNQSFRKVIYNCPLNSSSANYFNPTAIQDTLYVVNTGNSTPRTLQLDSTGATISIATLVVGSGSSSYYFNGGIITSNPVVVSLGTNHAPTITVAGDVRIQGNSSTNTATLYSSSVGAVLNVGGNWNIGSNSIFTSTNIAVNFDGSGTSSTPQTITTGGQSFGALTVSNSTYVELASSATVTGNLTLTSGTLDVSTSNYALTVGGNFTNTAGTFTCNSGLVTFNGTGTQIISGSNTFNNLTDVTGGATLQFTAGTTQAVNGTLTLTGGISGNLLVVKSTIPGTQATINPTASSVSYCAITDMLNSNSTAIATTHSTNGGDNTNITFQSVYWIGGANGDWNTATNWSTGSVPGAGDVVVFDGNNIDGASTAGTSVVINPAFASQTIGGITIQNNNLTVSLGSATNILTLSTSGILTINSGDTLDLGGNSLACATLTTSGTGTLSTQSTIVTPTPTGRTWSVNVNFNNATGVQTVLPGTYNGGLTISNTSGVDSVSGTVTVNSTLTLNTGSTLSLGSVSTNLITGTLTGSTGSGTFLLANTSNSTYKIPSGLTWGGTFKYGYNGNPRITPGIYNNLIVDNGTSGVTAHVINWGTTNETGTISIAGTFSIDNVSSFVTNTTTVKFTGTSQSIISLYSSFTTTSVSFYNFDISGAIGFAFPSGTTSIANTFTPGTNVTSATLGTINFNGTSGQTIPAFNYYNLSISGAQTSSNNITLASSGTIGIADAFSYTATYTTGSLVSTGSTINFNGSSGSTIPAFSYNNLSISGVQSGANNITLASSGTISFAGTFSPTATFGTGGYVVTGSTVSFVGSSAQSIPAFIYNNLTIANSTGISSTASSAITVNGNLGLTSGILNDGGNVITVGGSITGTGSETGTGEIKMLSTSSSQSISSVTLNNIELDGTASGHNFNISTSAATNTVINGTLTLTYGFLAINSGNTLTMGNGSTIVKNGGSNSPLNLNSGTFYYGTTSTDKVNIIIGATTAYGSELLSTQTPGSVGTLTINSGVTYSIAGSRTVTNLVNNGIVALTASPTFTINGTLSGSGTITGATTASLSFGSTANGTLNFTSGAQVANNITLNTSGTITMGTPVVISSSLVLTSGTLNDGGNTVSVNGSVTGTGTHTGTGLLLITGGSSTHYIGATTGTINLGNVQVNSSSYIVGLAGNAVINGILTLTSGLFNVYSYNLSLANAPVGYNSSSYIYHFSTGTGTLTLNNVGSGSVIFPVGISSNYVPVTFTGTTNTPNITLGFGLTITNAPINSSNVVDVQWSILSSTSSTSTVTFQYTSNLQASGYITGSTVVAGIYASGAYTETILGSVSGTSPYTVSTTSAIALPTGSTSLYVIGNQYSFTAGVPTPSITYLTGGNSQATLGFSAVSNGASITGYTITPYIGGTAQMPITGISSSPYTVTGLTNGTTYTFTVSAANSVGTGTSASSNAVTIAVPTIYDSILTNRTAAIQLNTPSNATSLISATYGYINGGILSDSTFSSLGEPPATTSPNKDLYYVNYLSLIQNMAEVYTYNYTYIKNGVNETGYNNPAVLAAIKQTLTWWLQRVPYYTCNNWHNATITYPLNLGNVLVLMRGIGVNVDTTGWGTIETNAINLVYANPETPNTGLIANGYLSPSTNTGDNRTNICDYWLDWGCLTKNVNSNGWDVVDTAINELYTTMDYTQSLPDGYKQDNSFMQHYAQDYTQQYGGGWAYDILAFGNYLKNTSKVMSQTKLDLIYNYVHNSYYASARGIYKDFSRNGREISILNNNLVDSTIAKLGALVDPTPSHITDYNTDLANCETSNPNYSGDTIHTHYFVSDYTLHKRPNYNFSVRSVSTRTNMDESLNTQNLLGTFLAQGATSIMVHGNENNNSFANWNWNYVPGVTMSDSLDGSGNSATQQNTNYGQYDTGYTRFVGGVSDGKYGASTLSLSYDNVTGNKSWFFFDSAVVCLGDNIQSAKTGMNIVTSVNQQLINGPIYYNNTAGGSYTTFTPPTNATANTVTGTNIYSVFHDSIGYFFPTGNNVTIKQDSVYGNWYNIDNLYITSIPDTTDMFQLSINHGVAPSAASYQYIVAPGISYSTMQSYNPLNTISILANTKYVQAVKHNGLNMMQVIFDSATSITDPTSGITVKVNQPCALMLGNMNQNPLTVTVSDPTQLLSNLTVTMSYSSNASQFNVVNETLPSGYFVGSSASFTVDSTTAAATWVGTTSTNYSTASNWLANVAPTTGANIIIASGAPHYPILNSSTATTINNMTISGGSFTVNSTDTLRIDSAIINTAGTVTVNGTVSYVGTSAQTIAASTFASNTINNLRINNTAGVTLGGALNVSGTLYSTAGALNAAGYLTLLSSSTGTARVDNVYGSIVGNVNVQRYITAKTARKFSFIGSSVAASIRSAWQQQIYITGTGTGGNACGSTTGDGVASTDMYNSNGFDVTQSNTASMFTYNATKINGSRYVSVANTDQTNLVPGIGYILNIRGNRADGNCANQLETGSPAPPDAATLNATGTLTTGNVSATLYDTTLSKYTLLANPYPSQLSFSAFQTSNSTNVYNKMWTYSPFGSGNYTTYLNGIIANGATSYDNTTGNYIASGQAFFVEATQAGSAGTVTFNESHKTSGAIPNTQYFGATDNKLIRISLQAASDSSLLDEVVVRFNSEGSPVYNPFADAHSFSAANQTLVSLKGTNRLAIATHPTIVDTDTTQLGITSKSTGAFRLLFSDYQALDNTKTITLIDNFLGTTQDVRSTQGYNFNITADSASQGNNRFKIIVVGANPLPVSFTSIAATKNSDGVNVKWTIANQVNIANYEVERSTDGSSFANIATTKAANTNNYSVEDKNIPTTANTLYYRIKSIGEDGSIKYSSIAKLIIHNSLLTTLSIYPNPVQNKLNINLGTATNGTYKVRIITVAGVEAFSKTNVVTNGNSITIDASKLAGGVYLLELTDELGTKQLEKFVKN